MYKIAIVSHRETNCGVYNFAKITYEILSKSQKYRYEFVNVDNIQEFAQWYASTDANAILFNYHHAVTAWYTESVSKEIALPQFIITGHDGCIYYPSALTHFVCDPTLRSDTFVAMPRPIPHFNNVVYSPPKKQLRIGSFGFGQYAKNFPGIVQIVNEQFIEPVELNLHISYGAFVDPSGGLAHEIADHCRRIANNNVLLNITHDFMSTYDIVKFLNSNDINIFNYDEQEGRGVSSCIDYALAAKKPFAISDSSMFRHVSHNQSILLSKNKIKDIVQKNIMTLMEHYAANSHEKFISCFENKFDQFLVNDSIIELFKDTTAFKEDFKFPFSNINKIKKSYSQAGQDLFVLAALKGKMNGTYLEIGSNDPISSSNTYLLESIFHWRGVSMDIDFESVTRFNKRRTNIAELADAITIDYTKLLERSNLPINQIDYLSIDCDPAPNTYAALRNIPFDSTKFAVITYEHDGYLMGDTWMDLSRQYLVSKGYVLVVSKLAVTDTTYFEDWWVHPDLVDMDHIGKMIANDDSIKYFKRYLFN